MGRTRMRDLALMAAVLAIPSLTLAQAPSTGRRMTPEALDQMVPKHPEFPSALAPENLKKPRPKPPFDLTGTWFIDLSEGFGIFTAKNSTSMDGIKVEKKTVDAMNDSPVTKHLNFRWF